jgi:hypothetical protein
MPALFPAEAPATHPQMLPSASTTQAWLRS